LKDFTASGLSGLGRFRRATAHTSHADGPAKPTIVGAVVLEGEDPAVNGFAATTIADALCAACCVSRVVQDAADGRGAEDRWPQPRCSSHNRIDCQVCR
jgi:hypothetical protein